MASESGRQRAVREPFWATALSRMTAGGQRLARGVHGIIQRSANQQGIAWVGSGYRTVSTVPGSSVPEHGTGDALDVVFAENVGNKLSAQERAAALAFVAFIIANWRAIGLQWIIFSMDDVVSWSWNPDRGSWNRLADRGSVSGNHRDHVHIKIKAGSAGWTAALDALTIGAAATDTTPTPTPAWDGVSFPGRDAFALGSRHPAVTLLGQRLVAHGFGAHYQVGPGVPMGQADVENCRDFQQAQGWTGADTDGYPGPETWRRLMSSPGPKPTPPARPVQVSLSRLIAAAKTDPPRAGTPTSYADGVRVVEAALAAENLLVAGRVDGHFGTDTVAAYRRWQEWLGYRGRDADGIPGQASLGRLAGRNGFTVTD